MKIITGQSVVIPIEEWDAGKGNPYNTNNEEILVKYGYKIGRLGIHPENVELFTNSYRRKGGVEGVYLIAIFDNKDDAFKFAMLYNTEEGLEMDDVA